MVEDFRDCCEVARRVPAERVPDLGMIRYLPPCFGKSRHVVCFVRFIPYGNSHVRKSVQLIWIELVADVELSLFIRFKGVGDQTQMFTDRDYTWDVTACQ